MTEVVVPGMCVVVGLAGVHPSLQEVTVTMLVVRLVLVSVPEVYVTGHVVTVV
jgi:hypothetical protein